MAEYPNTVAGDVAYWDLSHGQAAHYRLRLVGLHCKIANMYLKQSARSSLRAVYGLGMAWGFGILALVIALTR